MTSRKPARPDLAAFLTREEVAELLGCHVATVDRRIRDRKLKALGDGRLVRISREDLNTYIRTHRKWQR